MEQKQPVTPTLSLALTPVILTLIILGTQIFYFGVFEPHIPLAIGVALASFVGIYQGLNWEEIRAGIFKVIHVALSSVSVLIVVGMIIGIWIASGTVPTIIYYGLKTLSPEIFLAAGMVICAVVAVSLGTSWGSVGTVGLALMGIGDGLISLFTGPPVRQSRAHSSAIRSRPYQTPQISRQQLPAPMCSLTYKI